MCFCATLIILLVFLFCFFILCVIKRKVNVYKQEGRGLLSKKIFCYSKIKSNDRCGSVAIEMNASVKRRETKQKETNQFLLSLSLARSLIIELKQIHFDRNTMTEQTPTLYNPTSLPPVYDTGQIKVNVGTGDYDLRNVAIPGRIRKFIGEKLCSNL